uniref:RAB6-interacting golgin n=1 Tax=Elaeophora elaphi TaxID=1147741 RepID=A0A0R3S5S1_9BILA
MSLCCFRVNMDDKEMVKKLRGTNHSSLSDRESFKSGACKSSHNDLPSDVVTSFKELYGKLATANLRVKAKKLKKAMTDEERREEQLIQQKQLESICEMIMQEPEKFGLHDKSEITEQMKLYSI